MGRHTDKTEIAYEDYLKLEGLRPSPESSERTARKGTRQTPCTTATPRVICWRKSGIVILPPVAP